MDRRDGPDDEALPFEAHVAVGAGRAPQADERALSIFDRVVIPVRIEIPLTPELRARIARAQGPHRR